MIKSFFKQNKIEYFEEISLKKYNTYRIDTKCKYLVFPKNTDELIAILKELNANILNAHMSKMNSKYGIGKQLVELTIETFDQEHKTQIVNALINSGFEVYVGE